MTTTSMNSKTGGKKARGINKVRERTASASLDQPLLWRGVISQAVVAAIAVAVGLWMNQLTGLILLTALSASVVAIIAYNLLFWRRATALWETHSPAKRSYVNSRRGAPMEESFVRALLVRRTNLVSLALYVAGFLVVLAVG